MDKSPEYSTEQSEENDLSPGLQELAAMADKMGQLQDNTPQEPEQVSEQKNDIANKENSIETFVNDRDILSTRCDKKDILGILMSKEYGDMLKAGISLNDLLESGALLGMSYHGDGYPDYDHKPDIEGDTKTIKETINIVANQYITGEKATTFKDILKARIKDEDLNDEQKSFLKKEDNIISDKILYNGQTFNADRIEKSSKGLDIGINSYRSIMGNHREGADDPELIEIAMGRLLPHMKYTAILLDDYKEAGKDVLSKDLEVKFSQLAESMCENILDCSYIEFGGSEDLFSLEGKELDLDDVFGKIILGYTDPYKLIERIKTHDLCNKEKRLEEEQCYIKEPDDIASYLLKRTNREYCVENLENLRELGVSEEKLAEITKSDILSEENQEQAEKPMTREELTQKLKHNIEWIKECNNDDLGIEDGHISADAALIDTISVLMKYVYGDNIPKEIEGIAEEFDNLPKWYA